MCIWNKVYPMAKRDNKRVKDWFLKLAEEIEGGQEWVGGASLPIPIPYVQLLWTLVNPVSNTICYP